MSRRRPSAVTRALSDPRVRQARWRAAAWAHRNALVSSLVAGGERIAGSAADTVDAARGHPRPWYVPPRSRRTVGGRNYREIGDAMARLLERRAGLTAESDVLDIGCGSGRVAVALTDRLGPEGSYEGFDVVEEAVEWCSSEITPRFPAFSFTHIDVGNDLYNADGSGPARQAAFPYPADAFDLAFAFSVFTHMRAEETSAYLHEVSRVLRPAGRILSTWYLIDKRPGRRPGRAGTPESWFPQEMPTGERVVSTHLPEYAVGIPRERMEAMHRAAGLELVEVVHGDWLGLPEADSREKRGFQDKVVAVPAG